MQRISEQQARKLMEAGAVVLDVRSPGEYAQGHIPRAINLPLDEISRAGAFVPDHNQPIVVYCSAGIRSARAAAVLTAGGWTKVYHLGPLSTWSGPLV